MRARMVSFTAALAVGGSARRTLVVTGTKALTVGSRHGRVHVASASTASSPPRA